MITLLEPSARFETTAQGSSPLTTTALSSVATTNVQSTSVYLTEVHVNATLTTVASTAPESAVNVSTSAVVELSTAAVLQTVTLTNVASASVTTVVPVVSNTAIAQATDVDYSDNRMAYLRFPTWIIRLDHSTAPPTRGIAMSQDWGRRSELAYG